MLRPHASASSGDGASTSRSAGIDSLFRSTRTIAFPRRMVLLGALLCAGSLLLHMWSFAAMATLRSQLEACNGAAGVGAGAPSIRTELDPLRSTLPSVARPTANAVRLIEQVREAAQPSPAAAVPTTPTTLPPQPTPITLTAAQISKLEEPWRWFETSGEHKDLQTKIQSLREERAHPLVILDIGLNIGSAPYAITKLCPVSWKRIATAAGSCDVLSDRSMCCASAGLSDLRFRADSGVLRFRCL
jgi:hypothetical protein